MRDWDVKITAPNGASGHLVVASDATDEAIVRQFSDFVRTARTHDVKPVAGIEGSPALTQSRKQAVSPRSAK